MVAASFWLGMKWRRANRNAAWASIGATAVLFFILPLVVPRLQPSLRSDTFLLKTTDPSPITRTYTVWEMDVVQRREEIREWEKQAAREQSRLPRPTDLQTGDHFEKVFAVPRRFIFWTKGATEKDGRLEGRGMLSLELVLLDKFGCALSQNPHALNETIRILIRTFTPFLLFIIVALATKPDDQNRLDRFYVKMKTPVNLDRDEDRKELELSYANPQRFDGKKLFRHSNWEFDKWDKVDIVGFLISVSGVFAVIGLLKFLLSIGG